MTLTFFSTRAEVSLFHVLLIDDFLFSSNRNTKEHQPLRQELRELSAPHEQHTNNPALSVCAISGIIIYGSCNRKFQRARI